MSLSSHYQNQKGYIRGAEELAALVAFVAKMDERWNAEAKLRPQTGGLFVERRRPLGQLVSSCLRTLPQITAQIIL